MSENQPLEAQNPQGQFTQPAPTPQKKSGLGIASLVLGIIAIVGSWIPILNNLSFLLAIIGLILGIVGIVAIRKGKVGGKGLTIAAIIINVVAIVIVICTQWVFGKALDEFSKDLDSGPKVVSTSEKADAGDSKKADQKADNSNLAIGKSVTLDNGLQISVDSKVEKTDQAGDKYLLVTVTYKNTGSDPVDYNEFEWKQTSASGNMEDPEIPILDEEPLNTGTLKAGGTVTGIIPVKPDAASLSYFGNIMDKEATATWLLK